MKRFVSMMAYGVLALGLSLGVARAADSEPAIHVSSLALEGEIEGENIVFSLTLRADVREKNARLPLVSGEVAYLSGKWPRSAELVREGDTYVLEFPRRGKASVSFKFASRALKEDAWRRTRFQIPAAGIRKLSVLCDRPDLEIAFPGALNVERETTEDDRLKATAYLGVAGQFEVGWKPEVKRLDSELVVTCDANVMATASVGALRLNTILTYRVIQGRLEKLSLLLPDTNVTQVRGEGIQDWRIDRSDPKTPRLLVDLSRPVDELYRLQVESELVVPEFPCDFDLPVMVPEDVIRSSGFVMMGTDSAIKLQVNRAAGVTQVDQDVFPSVTLAKGVERPRPSRVLYAYQYASTPYALRLTADDVVTALSSDENIVVRLAENEVVVTASFEVDIKDAPARELQIDVLGARGWTITDVSGRNIVEADVDIQERADSHILQIPFSAAVSGTVLVNVRMETPIEKTTARFDVPHFVVAGAKSERGYIVVAAEEGVRLKPDQVTGMREVHTGSAPVRVQGAQQAFRFREPGWNLSLQVDRAKPTVHCEVFHLASVGEGVAYHSVSISYHIGGAPLREVQVQVPESITTVEFTGADIEGWTREKDVCTVRFQERMIGDYTLLVTHDGQFADDGDDLAIGAITTLDTESEVGYVAVASSLSLDVSEAEPLPSAVIVIDRGEIPAAYTAPVTDPILRAYKILRSPHLISARLAPYDTDPLLGQVADYVKLATRLSRDGESVTTADYFIKNATRQYLVVHLPEGAKLWSIRRVQEDDSRVDVLSQESAAGLLVPVSRPLDPNTPIQIEVTYAEKLRPLGFWRTGLRPLRFAGPALPQAHATFTSWTVDVPSAFAIARSGGNMLSINRTPSGLVSLAQQTGRFVAAVFDGPGDRRVAPELRGERGGGRSVEHKRTVNLAGGDGLLLKLWIVPGWIGPGGSVLLLGVSLLAGLLVLVGCRRHHSGVSLRALGVTLVIVGLAETAAGRGLAVLVVTALLLWGLLTWVRWGFSAMKRNRAVRRAARPQGVVPPVPVPVVAADEVLFVPDDNETPGTSGFVRLALLPVLCAVALCASLLRGAETPAQAPAPQAELAQQEIQCLPEPVAPPVVLDVVELAVAGPAMDPESEKSAEVTAVMSFELDDPARIRILPRQAVLKTVDTGSDRVEVMSEADGYWLDVQRKGDYRVSVVYQLPVKEQDGVWMLPLHIPASMKNLLLASLPGSELEVSSDEAVYLKTSEHDGVTQVELVAGPQGDLVLRWHPRVRKTKLEKALYFCEVNALALLQPGVIDLVNRVRYQVAQGEIRDMKIEIPQGMSVTSLQAEHLATWSFDPATGMLEAILDRPVSGDYALTVMTQISREGLPYSATLGVPRVQGAVRQRGSLSIAALDSVQVRMGDVAGLSGMNIEDFSETVVSSAQKLAGARRGAMTVRRAYRYQDAAAVRAELETEQVLPEVRVVETGTLSIADERIVLSSKLELRVARSGLFSIELGIPADYEVESLTGPDVSHWDDDRAGTNGVDGASERVVTVHVNRRVTDATSLNLVVARMEKGIEPLITVPRVRVTDARKHTGAFTVSAERGVRLMVESRNGIDIKKASEKGIHRPGVLVFDLLRPSWSLILKTEVLAPLVKPEVLQVVDLTEGMLQCKVYLRYRIENAGVNRFRLQVPYPEASLTVAGRNVARVHAVDREQGIWEVDLTGKVEDLYSMRASYQLPYDTDSRMASVQPLRTLDTADQRGYLVITCNGRVEVTPQTVPPGLKGENPRNVPSTFGAGDLSGAVLCYRTLRPDYDLPLNVVRHDSAGVLPASIDSVRMTSVVSSARRLLTKVSLAITVGDLRFLQMELPNPKDELWTVLVNGRETAAARDGETYRIPLEQEAGASTSLELIYAGSASGSRLSRRQKYVAPRFLNLPLNDIRWTLYVASGMRYHGFGGTLTPEQTTGIVVPSVFSMGRYAEWNQSQRSQSIEKARQELGQAEEMARSGKNKQAQYAFQQALNYSQSQADLNEDARVQLRNLVKQQVKVGLVNRRDAVRFSNNIIDEQQLGQMEQFNDGEFTQEYASQVEQRLTARDNAGLEIVADKIIDQQAAAAGEVTAIRITMPQDGKPLIFTRALQIDPDGELAVSFKAGGNAWRRGLGASGMVLALYACCLVVLRRKRG